MKDNFVKLYTTDGEKLSDPIWNEYPRPMLFRNSFFNLNGKWEFAVSESENIPHRFPLEITVPFVPESVLSGLDMTIPESSYLFYRRTFILPAGFRRDRVIFHVGACDQYADVYINGKHLGSHKGGYDPFSFDITDCVSDGENTVVIRAFDDLSSGLIPYGKQRRRRGGMWYTPVSGIWQTVWIESTPEKYVKAIKTEIKGNTVYFKVKGVKHGRIILFTPEEKVRFFIEDGRAEYKVENPRFWSPEDPYLYRFFVETDGDLVESYFAFRTLEIKEIDGIKRLCLNGKPYFFNGLLDQGYFSDGIFTPAAPEGYEKDIKFAKSLGFNTLRKHIKVEPEKFYYDCDRLGMIVFQDMVNNGKYSFLRDTVLPTIGIKNLPDKYLHRNEKSREEFLHSMFKTVTRLYNHPCVCLWTIFNEGWGQFSSSDVYEGLKKLDSTRFIDTASGWFKGGESDVESVHCYFKQYKQKPAEKPILLTEFGGYSFRPFEHSFNTEKTYGYKYFDNKKAFENDILRLYIEEIIPNIENGLCGAIYTQLSDVEDETNGLISYDRKVVKVSPEKFRTVARQLKIKGKKSSESGL